MQSHLSTIHCNFQIMSNIASYSNLMDLLPLCQKSGYPKSLGVDITIWLLKDHIHTELDTSDLQPLRMECLLVDTQLFLLTFWYRMNSNPRLEIRKTFTFLLTPNSKQPLQYLSSSLDQTEIQLSFTIGPQGKLPFKASRKNVTENLIHHLIFPKKTYGISSRIDLSKDSEINVIDPEIKVVNAIPVIDLEEEELQLHKRKEKEQKEI